MNDFYTYELAYPDGTVFYVGKGKGNRIGDHEKEARAGKQSYKCNVIRQIWRDGGKVIKTKIQENMIEEDAYRLEIDLIRMYGRKHLTNLTDGGEGAVTGAGIVVTLSIPAEDYEIFQAILKYEGTEVTLEKCRERIRWTLKKALKAEEKRYFDTLLLQEQLKSSR